MALDTADRRASAINVGLPFGRVYPQPDGEMSNTMNAAVHADWMHIAFLYRGIAVEIHTDTVFAAPYIQRRRAFRLVIYEPLPGTNRLDLYDLNPEITSLRYRTATPGGFTTMEVGYPHPDLPHGVVPQLGRTPPRCRGQLWEGGSLCFEGLLSSGNGIGGMNGLSFIGYLLGGSLDGYITSADAVASTAGEILRSVIAQAAPNLSTAGVLGWRDSGIAHTLGEMNYRTPQAVIMQLSSEGGISNLGNRIWDATVYEGRRLRFLPRDEPEQPRYLIPYEGLPWLDWNEVYDNMYSSAAVLYTVAGTETITDVATTAGFVSRWGFERTQLLTMGESTQAAAEAYRDTWLAMHAQPEYSIVVTRTDERGLELFGGGSYPAHLVRAGDPDGWVQVGLGEPNDPVLPIVGTEYDAVSGMARYELGMPNVFDNGESLAVVCQETSSLTRWLHPLTGTRMRT